METSVVENKPKLKRTLGLAETTLMGVGVMLGAGIYALVGQASGLAGNAVWASFMLASLVAGFTGLSYAELSSFIPKAGGEYYYARRALGSLAAFLVTWSLTVGIAIVASTVALGFGGYLAGMTGSNLLWSASLLIVTMAALLIYGIQQSAWVAGFCTILEVIGLVVVVAVGAPHLGSVNYLEMSPDGFHGVASAAALIFFAYIGFEEIVQLSEETRDATKSIPLAILLSISVTTLIYVAVAACAVSVVDWEKLGASESPLADVVAVALGRKAFFGLSVIALFSTANTVLILMMSAARLLYGMAEDGQLPKGLAAVHRTRKSPYIATLVVAAISILMIVALREIAVVANLANFTLLMAFVVINVAVIVLRFREPDTNRPFRVPGSIGKLPLIPCFGIVTSLFMVSFLGLVTTLTGIGVAAIGTVVYFFKLRQPQKEPRI